MPRSFPGLDRVAILLSGACVVHCLLTAILLAMMSAAGGLLGAPIVHEVGLAVAIALAVIALGRGAIAHGRWLPAVTGIAGVTLMTGAVVGPHGAIEIVLTVSGVALLATAHTLNRRASLHR